MESIIRTTLIYVENRPGMAPEVKVNGHSLVAPIANSPSPKCLSFESNFWTTSSGFACSGFILEAPVSETKDNLVAMLSALSHVLVALLRVCRHWLRSFFTPYMHPDTINENK